MEIERLQAQLRAEFRRGEGFKKVATKLQDDLKRTKESCSEDIIQVDSPYIKTAKACQKGWRWSRKSRCTPRRLRVQPQGLGESLEKRVVGSRRVIVFRDCISDNRQMLTRFS